MNNPLETYNFPPTTITGNQFVSYRQPGGYFTDYRPSSDTYAYLVREASGKGVLTGHQLRQYLQDNSQELSNTFLSTAASNFRSMQLQGAPNTCSGSEGGIVYSGGQPLVNENKETQYLRNDYNNTGKRCMMLWDNTPLPQQGPHYQTVDSSTGSYSVNNLLD